MSKKVRALPDHAWQTYRRLFAYAWPYRVRLLYGMLFGMVYAGSSAGLLWAIKGGLAEVIDVQNAPMSAVLTATMLIPLVAILRGLGEFGSKYYVQWVGNRVVMDLRIAVFDRINRLSLNYFIKSRSGELISRVTNDTTVVQGSVSTVVQDIAKEPLTVIAILGFILWLDPVLSLIAIVLFPICIIPVALFSRRVRKFARSSQERIADLLSILQENILCVRVVKAFGMEDYEKSRFYQACHSFFRMTMKVTVARAAVEPLIFLISTLGVGGLLLYIRYREMTGSEFISFAGALVMMYEPVKKLSRVHLQIEQAAVSADRVFEVIDEEITVVDRPDAETFSDRIDVIEFDHVHFAYGETPVLSDIALRISAGSRVALVGGSGAGKTTLVSLIPRFFDPTGGAIRFNGRDLRDFSLKSLRQQIGLVTQDTVLFNESVAFNIAYGTPSASRDEVIAAAKKANADAFIRAMSDGYDTVIGEHGMRLSGGQRQRLAIARAILRNPPILLLDEATSALDTESERLVQDALQDLMVGRTVFAIAHRLSTITHCDRILVLDQGRVAEDGTHGELLARGGIYHRLYEMQFSS